MKGLSQAGAVLAVVSLSAACREKPPVDMLGQGIALRAGQVAGRDAKWIAGEVGKPVRIHNVVRRTLPASPPSTLEYSIEIPKGAHFTVSCGVAESHQSKPGVEFVVKLRQKDGERILASHLVDPMNREKQRRWTPLDVDLSKYTGEATLVLETRSFDVTPDDTTRAYWGAPLVTVPGKKAPLVIVYLVDTLRADHTSPYGYARDTTPELTKLAADGVVFDAAITAASWTKPAVGSIFTSKLPAQHGAVQLRDPLGLGHLTLAEMLRAKGYVTGATIANSVIYSAGTNFDQGFLHFAGLHGPNDRPSKLVEAAGVVDAALEWLDQRQGMPAFLYVHTMDPHVPYQPPPPFDRKYGPPPTADHPASDPRFDYKEPLDLERLIGQYDGDIAYGDQEFGRFIRELKARELYDDALLVFTADHGEEFQDHGQWLHGRSVFDELVRIPLIVKFPGRRHAGRRVKQQVQTVDILPTVLQEMKLPVPEPPLIVGRPLQKVVDGGAPEPLAVSEISHRGYVSFGIRSGGDKYIWRFSPEDDELYFDLGKDPGEKSNRLADAKDRGHELKSKLEDAMLPSPYLHHLRFAGDGVYRLALKSNGYIESVEALDFGSGERAEVERSKRSLAIEARPKKGQAREVVLSVRPVGAPVWVSGTRNGKPLRPEDVFIAKENLAPAGVPFKLPEIEPVDASPRSAAGRSARPASRGPAIDESKASMLEAPLGNPDGLQIWLTLRPGFELTTMDEETRQQLKALGYLGG
jgi:arylsulfatase A-like enzyme